MTKEYIEVKQLEQLYPAVMHKDFRELLDYTLENYATEDAFIVKHKNGKEVIYDHITYERFHSNVNELGTALLKRGLKDSRIAIIGNNRYEWMVAYFATLCGLGISIPLDKGLPYEEVETSLSRAYADVLFFDKAHVEIVEELKAKDSTKIKTYICMEELEGYLSIPQLFEEGRAAIGEGFNEYKSLPIDEKAITILLFTSGTTSLAKAVELSQFNVMSNVYSLEKVINFHVGDVNMAFLPYHHTFGSTGQTIMLAGGVTTAFCDGLKYLQKNMVEYKVSIFFCVPLLIESIYKKIMQTVKKEGLEGKVNFGLKLSGFLRKFGIDIRRKLFKDILAQLGGNIRYVISGASAIDPEALKGFNAFGIETIQGYGMTESCPVLAAENEKHQRAGSIGHAIPDVELRIENPNEEGIGELIARGPNVMNGYFENEEETAKVLEDGWLHTGDLAYADKDGYLFICGRKKNVIVLKNGKNVYPEEIEVLISNLPYVEENMVFGEPRHNDGDLNDLAICAKIVYKPDVMKDNYNACEPLEIEKIIKADLDKINNSLPVYKQMQRLIVTDRPMVKTTTGKVKRYKETQDIKATK